LKRFSFNRISSKLLLLLLFILKYLGAIAIAAAVTSTIMPPAVAVAVVVVFEYYGGGDDGDAAIPMPATKIINDTKINMNFRLIMVIDLWRTTHSDWLNQYIILKKFVLVTGNIKRVKK
jgi:hypothetical protein